MNLELLTIKSSEIALGEAAKTLLQNRRDRAIALVIEELRNGKVDPEEASKRDDVVAMLVSFFMAMAQGAAFKNLRVIAKVLAHKAADRKQRTDDFIMWSNALAGLLHEEAVLLATLQRHHEAALGRHSTEAVKYAMDATKAELVGTGKPFSNENDFKAACGALARTGFVVLLSAWGSIAVAPSPRLTKLAEMANLQQWADDRNHD